ncbi:MAG: YigZ family protein [Lentisphaeria bacterium]
MKILQAYSSAEMTVKNSRFLAEAFPVVTTEEAHEILRSQKEKYAGCRHVVHAFIVGLNADIMGCSDNGEPSGTAGRPALEVLKGSDITNFIVTIARWFGGTKLGTGGLVKAYTESTQLVLADASVCEWVPKTDFVTTVDYHIYEQVKRLLTNAAVEDLKESFDQGVTLSGRLQDKEMDLIQTQIRDLSRGQATIHFISSSPEEDIKSE